MNNPANWCRHLQLEGLKPADRVILEGNWDERAASAVTSEGVLLWAFDNPFSIPALAGKRDEATGTLYRSVCGATTTLRERREQATAAGLTILAEHLLFPGLNDATTVVTRELAISHPLLTARIGASALQPMAGMPRLISFPESLALTQAARAGLLSEVSPAILLILARNPSNEAVRRLLSPQNTNGERAWHHSVGRRIPCHTVIRRLPDGALVAMKRAALPGLTSPHPLPGPEGSPFSLEWIHGIETPVIEGQPLTEELHGLLHAGQWSAFESRMLEFLSRALETFTPSGETTATGLRPEALDATIINAVRDGQQNRWNFFDLEWRLAGTEARMRPSWYVLRNVFVLARNFELFSPATSFGSLSTLYDSLCRRLGLTPDFEGDVRLEAHLQALASQDTDPAAHAKRIKTNLQHRFDVEWIPRSAERELTMRSRYPKLERESRAWGSKLARKLQKILGHPAFQENR